MASDDVWESFLQVCVIYISCLWFSCMVYRWVCFIPNYLVQIFNDRETLVQKSRRFIPLHGAWGDFGLTVATGQMAYGPHKVTQNLEEEQEPRASRRGLGRLGWIAWRGQPSHTRTAEGNSRVTTKKKSLTMIESTSESLAKILEYMQWGFSEMHSRFAAASGVQGSTSLRWKMHKMTHWSLNGASYCWKHRQTSAKIVTRGQPTG